MHRCWDGFDGGRGLAASGYSLCLDFSQFPSLPPSLQGFMRTEAFIQLFVAWTGVLVGCLRGAASWTGEEVTVLPAKSGSCSMLEPSSQLRPRLQISLGCPELRTSMAINPKPRCCVSQPLIGLGFFGSGLLCGHSPLHSAVWCQPASWLCVCPSQPQDDGARCRRLEVFHK